MRYAVPSPLTPALLACAAYAALCALFGVPALQAASYLGYVLLFIVLPASVLAMRRDGTGWASFVLLLVVAHAVETASFVAFLYARLGDWFYLYPVPWLLFGARGIERAAAQLRQPARRPLLPMLLYALTAIVLTAAPILYDFHTGEHHSLWLMAYTQAIAAQLPPVDPFFAGQTLLYHYFYNAHALAVHHVMGGDLYQTLRFTAPIAGFGMLIATACAAAHLLFRRSWIGLLIMVQFLAFYGYGAAYSYFQTANAQIIYQVPSMLAALSLFMTLLALIPAYLTRGAGLTLILFLMLVIAGFRGNALPIILCGIAGTWVAAGFARPRRYGPLLAAALAAFVITFLLFFSGDNSGHAIMRFAPLNDSVALTGTGTPSPVYTWLLDHAGHGGVAVLIFVLLLAAFKQLVLLPAIPVAIRRGWSLFQAQRLFYLACWGAGLAVLLLFDNRVNEQWSFYIFAQLALSFLLADMLAHALDHGGWGRGMRIAAGLAILIVTAQMVPFTTQLAEGLARAPLGKTTQLLPPESEAAQFVAKVRAADLRGVVIPYHKQAFDPATATFDTRLLTVLGPELAVYHSQVGIHIMQRNGLLPEMQRRIDFTKSPPRCDRLQEEAARFEGDILLYTDAPSIRVPAACTTLVARQGNHNLYRFTPR